MNHGLKRPRPDRRDFDFHRTFGVTATSLPDEYTTEAKLWNPDQNTGTDLFTPPVPPMPYGCTNYTQADLCSDEDQELRNPMLLENVTHANARLGIDIRESLSAAKQVFGRTAYFNVRWSGVIDPFDAVRLAMLSTASEHRAVSIGSPYYPEFMLIDEYGRVPAPLDYSLKNATWHNWAVKGWKTVRGEPCLIGKDWTGRFKLFPRQTFNALMNIPGSCAYTLSKTVPETIQTVGVSIYVQEIVAYIRHLLGL